MPSKHILIVSTAYLPLVGGAELAIKEITDRFEDKYAFELVCARIKRDLAPQERIGNVMVYRVGRGSFLDKYLLAWRAYRMLKFGDYDFAWVVMASYGSLFIPRTKKPYLLTLQEGDSERHILRRVGIFYQLWRKVFENASYIQAISSYLADFARRRGAKCPIEVIPNGVDTSRFKIKDSRFKNKDNRFTIITTSRLVHKNGIDILIRAVAQLKTYNLKLKTLIVGDGLDRAKLENLAKELGLEGSIEFTGHTDPDKIPAYLAQADIFVRPSRSEGLGSSFIEAMAAGLPIIGTPVGGIPDFLRDGETGIFAQPDDPEDLAEKIKLLLEKKGLREKLSKQGRELALRDYSWDSIAERMSSIFNKLIEL